MEAQPIQALSKDLINKIAAGEVIGAPVNVIKELLENSIDACADQIEITIENGGYSLIKIRDDGTGIRRSDMEKACIRHTTSKLSKFVELEKIGTFGFRGEALASMSRCAHVTITTRTYQEPSGYTADYADEKMITPVTNTAMNEGTIIEVKDLFYNDPKRLASRGKATTDVKNICDVVSKYAIAYPQQSITLISNNKELLHTYGQSTSEEVLKLLFNIEDAKSIFNLTTSPCVNVSANCFLSAPSYAAKKKMCGFFINGRLVQCSTLKNAIESAYTESVGVTAKPFYVVILKMPQENVDVNVHPQKQLVKFLNEVEISESMHDTIREALDSRRHSRPVLQIREKPKTKKTLMSQVPQGNSQITKYMSQTQDKEKEKETVEAELSPLDRARLALGLPLSQDTKKKNDAKKKESDSSSDEALVPGPLKLKLSSPKSVVSKTAIPTTTRTAAEPPTITGSFISDSDDEAETPAPPSFKPADAEAEEEKGEELVNAPTNDSPDLSENDLPKPSIDDMSNFSFSLPKVPQSVKKMALQAEKPKSTRSKSVQRSTLFEELKFAPKQKIAEDMGMRTLEQMFTPPTIIAKPFRKVELKSILQMRAGILENESTTLTNIIKNSKFVGFVGLNNLLLQSGDGLFLCNTYGLIKDFFVHKILDLFQNFSQYRLPRCIDIEQTVNVIGKDGKAAAEVLQANSALLLDYFSISIDNGKLYSMPSLVYGYKPSYSSMPLFLYNIATNVDWEDEAECLAYLIDEIASVSSPIPEDELDEEVAKRLKNEIMSLIIPAMNGDMYSASMDAGDSVVQLRTLAALYNEFNP